MFAQAMRGVPTVLGFVLDPDGGAGLKPITLLTRGAPALDLLWQTSGAVGPVEALRAASAGLGALALPGDADGVVRRVPLLVRAGGAMQAGLAAELVRVGAGASAYFLEARPLALAIGDARLHITGDALLRLAPGAAGREDGRTLSAADILEARTDVTRLRDALVLIGGSAPELGGLRQASEDALSPSVQIQADAVTQIMAGRAPLPLIETPFAELAIAFTAGLVTIAAGVLLAPWLGVAALVTLIACAWGGAVGLSLFADRLLDPVAPSAVAVAAFAASSVAAFAQTRAREARVRRRFEQHLAPAVVARIVAQPGLLKLGGERREVTALFTDIEGFTALTHRAGPEMLIAVLDGYFEGVAGIVVAHGGMVDKMVGDAVHALFNAPVDLADHPRRAVDCALAITAWAEDYRRIDLPHSLELGRTRIGIETGMAVVGDVGVRAKLDYTAHGDAVNMAARLEAANKELGSTICVGPGTVARCDVAQFRALGTIIVRGRTEPVKVFTPIDAA
jgi:adenylate cyclase